MKKIFKKIVMVVAFVTTGAAVSLVGQPAFAANDALNEACQADPSSVICKDSASAPTVAAVVKTIINILLFLIGIVATIMIILGGFRYATSAGNATALSAAKNTILYAIIGLLIAFFAFAIVNWVLINFK